MQAIELGTFNLSARIGCGDRSALDKADFVMARDSEGRMACVHGWILLKRFLSGDARFSGLQFVTIEYQAAELRELLQFVTSAKGSNDIGPV